MADLPQRFADVDALEEFMSAPSEALAADLAHAPGDILVLGVGGVARFSERGLREKLESQGIECIACDLLERAALERLPRPPNVIFMAGHKFGAAGW